MCYFFCPSLFSCAIWKQKRISSSLRCQSICHGDSTKKRSPPTAAALPAQTSQGQVEPVLMLRVFARFLFRRVCARSCVFATTRVFAKSVFGKCLCPPMCLRDDACLRQTCLRPVSSHTRRASLGEESWNGQSAQEVSLDGHVSSLREVSSKGTCLQTLTYLRCIRLTCVCRRLDWISSQTVPRNLSPRPHVVSKCGFCLRTICAPPQASNA